MGEVQFFVFGLIEFCTDSDPFPAGRSPCLITLSAVRQLQVQFNIKFAEKRGVNLLCSGSESEGQGRCGAVTQP